jgi:hypothetical protein
MLEVKPNRSEGSRGVAAHRTRPRDVEIDQAVSATHALSPELVLVDAQLRAVAIAALPDPVWATYAPPRVASTPLDAPTGGGRLDRSLIRGAVLYAAWHAALGAVLVCGAVLAAALTIFALSLATS